MKKTAYFLMAAALGFLIGKYYMLDGFWLVGCVLIGLAGVPFWIRIQKNSAYEEQRFQEITSYMEQMLYAFARKPKIVAAIEDVQMFYTEGEFTQLLDQVLIKIRKSEDEELYRGGNKLLEEVYECSRLRRMNRFFEQIEENGGSYKEAIELLQMDLAMYEERIMGLQKEKKNIGVRMVVAFAVSILICGTGNHLMPTTFSTAHSQLGQMSSLVLVAMNLLILLVTTNHLQRNWLKEKDEEDCNQLIRYYYKVQEEQEHKERIGYMIAYKKTLKAVKLAFPEWLLDVTLHLDSGNVQTALKKSRPYAQCIIGEALDQMEEELSIRPNGLEPYLKFLSVYHLTYVSQAMKTLYGISETGIGDARKQMQQLVKQNMFLLSKNEANRGENMVAAIGLVTLLPMITGSVKLMVDMVLFILTFMQKLVV